jgi:hypothetical protein
MSDDIRKRVESAPVGTYRVYRGSDIGLDENSINTHLKNLDGIGQRIQAAIEAGFLIEALSLRLQIIDYWLRIYFRNKRAQGEERQRQFGRLLD